jgi:surface polysaccharide O-acyltransferase-like enzyme
MLFNVFVFVWPFSPIIKKSDLLSVLIAGGFYLMSMLGPKIIPNYFQVWTSCRYVTFFLIGYKIRQHGSEMLMCIPSWIMLACNIVLFWLNRICAGSDFLGAGILTIGTGVACNVVGAIMVFAILQKIAPKKPCVVGKFVDEISKKSMTIYLFHQQIIYLFILLFNGVLHPYLNAAVNFIGSLTLSVVIAHILFQFRVTKFLIGEK